MMTYSEDIIILKVSSAAIVYSLVVRTSQYINLTLHQTSLIISFVSLFYYRGDASVDRVLCGHNDVVVWWSTSSFWKVMACDILCHI